MRWVYVGIVYSWMPYKILPCSIAPHSYHPDIIGYALFIGSQMRILGVLNVAMGIALLSAKNPVGIPILFIGIILLTEK